jgi:predicted protein tyrosine phosphatase
MKKHLLFVCSANIDRSKAGEDLFKKSRKYEAKSCGTHAFAETQITQEAIDWADIIFCMEHEHKQHIIDNFDVDINKIIVLNITNEYVRHDPELEKLLRNKLGDFLGG